VDVQKKLDEIAATIAGARSMPMSASCVVNRAELLAMLQEVSAALPDSLSQAEELLGDREQMVAEARAEAQRIIESAHAERGSLVSDTQIARQSQDEAERILAEARREAEEIRAEADDYVDSKLANFEVVLTKTIGSVDRGREKLLGRDPYAAQHQPQPQPQAHDQGGYGYQPEYAQAGYADPYGGAQGYEQQQGYDDPSGYGAQAPGYDYGQQQGYDDPSGYGAQVPYQQQPDQPPVPPQIPQQVPQQGYGQQPAALDETSFFDTGMIDLARLRELEQGGH
jgi:vacuolar-type H+-ATPase subunit H